MKWCYIVSNSQFHLECFASKVLQISLHSLDSFGFVNWLLSFSLSQSHTLTFFQANDVSNIILKLYFQIIGWLPDARILKPSSLTQRKCVDADPVVVVVHSQTRFGARACVCAVCILLCRIHWMCLRASWLECVSLNVCRCVYYVSATLQIIIFSAIMVFQDLNVISAGFTSSVRSMFYTAHSSLIHSFHSVIFTSIFFSITKLILYFKCSFFLF